uniref:Uncharacterized protein n=1 Tax=Macrostomum lignano TaxID=282301 RepID=A0A1I8FJ39_9PLAT
MTNLLDEASSASLLLILSAQVLICLGVTRSGPAWA